MDIRPNWAVSEEFRVLCLCAEWCGTCRDYKAGFFALAEVFPKIHFEWRDIEEHADEMGDLDVEDFPTLLICRRDSILFYGTMLPHHGHLRRMIEAFLEQSPEQSDAYARSSPDRALWQENEDLRRLGQLSRVRCQG